MVVQVVRFAALFLSLALAVAPVEGAPQLVNSLEIAGDSTDLAGGPPGPNLNRLGGFASDLYFDHFTKTYFGIPDRGPGGGLIDYDTRVQQFTVDVDATSGAISNFTLERTILFKDPSGKPFNGLNPLLLNGDKTTLGRSFDPEGLVVGKKGTFFVADEYGPSVYEFGQNGGFLRAFQTPANLLPKETGGTLNFVDGRPTIVTGRQDNRGYEGLAISPDGTRLYGVLQDPLVNEGNPDGRRGRMTRIVEFDVATGLATKQLVYELESLADINARVPGDTFGANAQGRNIGVSAIVALSATKFLVIERDNRGLGVDELIDSFAGLHAVASKRVFLIDITGATDVSGLSFAGIDTAAAAGIIPVSKTLVLDVQAALVAAGLTIPEKLEGLTVGPTLADGTFSLLLGTDNDFSVTQTGDVSTPQKDVCTDGSQIALGAACPAGSSLIPSFLYAFRDVDGLLAGYQLPARVPAPGSISMLSGGLAVLWALSRIRRGRPRQT